MPARSRIAFAARSLLWAGALGCLFAGCAQTEFFNEGPGVPAERATGSVPPGTLGVCKRIDTKRPPLVDKTLWDDAKLCTQRSPKGFIRLGYGDVEADEALQAETDVRMERMLQALRDAQDPKGGNLRFVSMLRQLRDLSLRDQVLRDRVERDSAREDACDYSYLLNTMQAARLRLSSKDPCAARAYDAPLRDELCIFDTSRAEAVWVSSAWDCVTHTEAVGSEQSCHRMCAYDDYCARQVSCAAADLDLLLCALGVCLPEKREGI